MHATLPLLQPTDFPFIKRDQLETLQVNMGYRCNQQCLHCHVNANPKRKEMMSRETVDDILSFLRKNKLANLDITGGAPELNPEFRYLVTEASKLGIHIMDRCNLTILLEPGFEDLTAFLAEHGVEIYASLPCYLEENVDQQRGQGIFEKSIEALKLLNHHGYGLPDTGLKLNLVYNPIGTSLPPPQLSLETDYKRELKQRFDVQFNRLFTLANMPIMRFGSQLVSQGEFNSYMNTLKNNYQTGNLDTVMCKTLLSVNWQGYLYDCDFNQMLELPAHITNKPRTHINEIESKQLEGLAISIADHCYGCTAGQGSSCGGALS